MKRRTNAINFLCKRSKIDKKGYAPIQMSITIDGIRTVIQLPRKERPEKFDINKPELARYLDIVRSKVYDAQGEMMMMDLPVTARSLKNYLIYGKEKPYTLGGMFENYTALLNDKLKRNEISKTTVDKYRLVMKEFDGQFKDDTEVKKITPNDISSFYLKESQRYKESTVAGKMIKLKSIFLWARDSGKITALPFAGIRIHRPPTSIDYLTAEEVRRIERLNTGIERLDRVKDIFLFQCGTGMAYGDMAEMKKEDLREKDGMWYIEKRRVKTGVIFCAVILPVALNALKRNDYDMKIISNQKMNAYLKEIAALAGIDKNLTTHLARKTYATYLMESGVRMSTISKCLGHSSTDVTESFYAARPTDMVIREVSDRCCSYLDKKKDANNTEFTQRQKG